MLYQIKFSLVRTLYHHTPKKHNLFSNTPKEKQKQCTYEFDVYKTMKAIDLMVYLDSLSACTLILALRCCKKTNRSSFLRQFVHNRRGESESDSFEDVPPLFASEPIHLYTPFFHVWQILSVFLPRRR